MSGPSKDEIRAADDMFSHGADYPAENGLIRHGTCPSCAFVSGPETVRPESTSIEALEMATAEYDDFLCHCLDKDGKAYTCAGWAARFGQDSCLVKHKSRASSPERDCHKRSAE